MGRLLRAVLLGSVALGLTLHLAAAATRYGTAVVKKGEMTIAREGQVLTFKASSKAIPVDEQDLVRVRDASEVVLTTSDHATLTIGANAVFQCNPWQSPKRNGVLRVLFGRFQADVRDAGVVGFNVKTRNATIGVKGTKYTLAETAGGNTIVLATEHTVAVAGTEGNEEPVSAGQMSFVIGDSAASPAITAPEEFRQAMANLDSPRLGTSEALDLPAENVLIDKDIVSKQALQKSKEDKAKVLGTGGAKDVPLPQLNLDDTEHTRSSDRMPEPEPKK